MKSDNFKLGEASFRSGMGGKIIEKIAIILSRHLGKAYNIAPLPFLNKGLEVYRIGIGNAAVDIKFETSSSDQIVEIDVFNKPSNTPKYTLEIAKTDSITQVIQAVEDALKGDLEYDG